MEHPNLTRVNGRRLGGHSSLPAARFHTDAPEAVRAVVKADPEYLDAMFRTIEAKFGSIDNYRRSALGISDTDLSVLKARLVED